MKPSTNTKNYSIRNINYESHELDDEVIYFTFDIYDTETDETLVKEYFHPLSNLLKHLKQHDAGLYNYFNSTRSSTGAWGPAEKRTLEAIGDEAIQQFYKHLKTFLEESDVLTEWVNHLNKRSDRPIQEQQKEQESLLQKLSDLREAGENMEEATKKINLFCELVEKKIREVAMEVYPEIKDMEAPKLRMFKYVFTNGISKLSSDLDNFILKE